ncbi:DUF4099 domain-containing protein [Alistipes communis]|uniref:DUF4099 domain-containing protein n=1 Tax=Alistipes communis TaxID=2585118 RepID=UPI0024325CA3|nr:DUF4099 domain-containing protein [Alistipes communis]
MLNYGKSDLVKVKPTFGGEIIRAGRPPLLQEGRRRGNISLVPHFIRKEQNWMSTRNTNSPTMTGRTSAKRAISVGRGHCGQKRRDHPLLHQHRP